MKKPVYIKCPRCELNYILKKDDYCEVCKQEMRAGALNEEREYEELEEGLELCPNCKINYLAEGERICPSCQEENEAFNKDDTELDWRELVDKTDEDEELDLLPVEEIDEELNSTFAKDLEDEFDDEEEDDNDFEDDLDLDFDDNFDDDDFDDEEDDEDDLEEYEEDDF